MKAFDELIIVFTSSLNHAGERIGKPLFELHMRLEDIRHEEMHE